MEDIENPLSGVEPLETIPTQLHLFTVSLMPFEKQLLAEIASTGDFRSPPQRRIDINIFSLIIRLFDRWQRKRATTHAIECLIDYIDDYLVEPDGDSTEQSFTTNQRLDCYRSFFATLGTPFQINRCYSQYSETKNPWFKTELLSAPDPRKVLSSVRTGLDIEDWGSWKILAEMFMKCQNEMERWTSEISSKVGLVQTREGFQIWQVVRMYSIHSTRPQSGPALLGLLESEEYKSLATKLLAQYEKTEDDQVKILSKVLDASLKVTSPDSDDQEESFSFQNWLMNHDQVLFYLIL